MIQNYKMVTLCGSTRFKDQFLETQKRLTLEGCIVISVGLFGHSLSLRKRVLSAYLTSTHLIVLQEILLHQLHSQDIL